MMVGTYGSVWETAVDMHVLREWDLSRSWNERHYFLVKKVFPTQELHQYEVRIESPERNRKPQSQKLKFKIIYWD